MYIRSALPLVLLSVLLTIPVARAQAQAQAQAGAEFEFILRTENGVSEYKFSAPSKSYIWTRSTATVTGHVKGNYFLPRHDRDVNRQVVYLAGDREQGSSTRSLVAKKDRHYFLETNNLKLRSAGHRAKMNGQTLIEVRFTKGEAPDIKSGDEVEIASVDGSALGSHLAKLILEHYVSGLRSSFARGPKSTLKVHDIEYGDDAGCKINAVSMICRTQIKAIHGTLAVRL
jgi:hypothetical protein